MATMSTGLFPQDLRPGVRMWFGQAYKLYDTKYDKLFDVKIPEDRAYEEDVAMSGLGLAVVKPQGSPVTYDSGNQLYSTRYTHVQYGLGFAITEEMLSDGIALKKAQIFAESLKNGMLRAREIVSANVYNNAFTSSALMEGGDGVCLGSNAHPTVAGNQSNIQANPAALSEAGLEQAVIDIQNTLDNRGQRIMLMPRKLILPLALQFTAERILKSPLRVATADNDINALQNMGMFPEGVVLDPFLTSSTNWHVRTDTPGLNFFNRKDITLSDDNEFDTENAKFKGLMRFSVGWSDFRAYYGANA